MIFGKPNCSSTEVCFDGIAGKMNSYIIAPNDWDGAAFASLCPDLADAAGGHFNWWVIWDPSVDEWDYFPNSITEIGVIDPNSPTDVSTTDVYDQIDGAFVTNTNLCTD